MANEFKIKKGLIVTGADGGTVVDIQGSQGQLFSVTDDLSGSIFAVSDISGVPIFDVNSSGVSYFDGSVGIGTDSPTSKLHVFGGSANTELKVTTNDNYIARLGLYEEKPGNLHGGFIQYRGESGDRLEIGSRNAGTDTVHMSIDDITGNVGIGTTSPGTKLTVDAGSNIASFRSVGSGQNNKELLIQTGGDRVILDAKNADDGTATALAFESGSSERMRITAAGNVGIGVTSSINGTLTLPNSGVISFHDANGDARNSLQFVSGELKHGAAGAGLTTQTFFTNSSERMRITSGGNVGIGTTSPGFKLDVSSGSAVGARISTTGFTNLDLVSNRTSGNLGGIRWKQDVDSFQTSEFLGLHGGGFDWKTGDGSVLPDIKMSMLSNGNVGIGTTSPRDTLEIVGNMRFVDGEDHLMIKPNNAIQGADFIVGDGVTTTDAPVMSLNGLYGGQVTIQTQGNTIANKTVLDVQGTQGQLFSVTDDLSGDIFSVADISGVPIMNVNSNGTSYFDGNVGIGTTSPSTKLDIINSGLSTMFRLSNTEANATTKYGAILGRHYTNTEENVTGMLITSSSNALSGQTVSIGGGISAANAVNNVIFYTAANNTTLTGSERMRITSGGNVGIGTTSPSNTLQVGDGTEDSAIAVYFSDGSYTRINGYGLYMSRTASYIRPTTTTTKTLYIGAPSNIWNAISNNANTHYFSTGTNEHMRINSAGNVGINTTSPVVKLHVQGNNIATRATTTAQSVLRLVRDVVDTAFPSTKDSAVDFMLSRQQAINNNLPYTRLDIRLAGTTDSSTPSLDVMSLLHNGNVGIGTITPGYKLEVNAGNGIFVGDGGVPVLSADSSTGIFKIGDTDELGDGVYATNTGSSFFDIYSTGSIKFRMNSAGDVGIGTTTPGDKLHVNGTVRTQAPTTSDWGLIGFNSAGTASSGLWFDNGSGDILLRRSDNSLQTRIRSAGNSYINGGNLGLNTTGPAERLTINSGRMLVTNSTTPIYIKVNSGYKSWVHHISSDDGYIFAPSTVDGGETWDWANQTKLGANGVVRAKNFELSSDERFKDNVKDIKDNEIKVAFKSFEIKSSPGEKRYGVIAQELEKNNPELVTTDTEGFKSVKYIDLLIAKIAELEARLEKLEK